MKKLYLGVDIGGSYIKIGVFDSGFNKKDEFKMPTEPKLGTDLLLCRLVEQIKTRFEHNNWLLKDLSGIGVASAGKVDEIHGVIECANNLPFEHFNIKNALQKTFSCPVFVGHDVRTAAFAEQQKGSLVGVQNAVYLALGTGLGACDILNGEIVTSPSGFMTELGHTTLHAGGELCSCGRRGCMEMYVSQKGLVKAMEQAGLGKDKTPFEKMAWLFQVNQCDQTAKTIVNQFVADLCELVLNIQSLYNPDKIVFGGGLSYHLPTILPQMKTQLQTFQFGYYAGVEKKIEIGAFQNEATMLGAVLKLK